MNLLRRILEAEPRGPYHLLGYSLGGYVSFEVARRLHAMNQHVAMLGLIDCIAPNAFAKRPLLERIRVHAALWLQAGSGARMHYLIDRVRSSLRSGEDYEPLIPKEQSGLSVENLRRMQRHMQRAAEGYTPGTYPGRVVLFRAIQPEWIKFTVMNEFMGWEPYVQGEIEVLPIPGQHLEVFKDPPRRCSDIGS